MIRLRDNITMINGTGQMIGAVVIEIHRHHCGRSRDLIEGDKLIGMAMAGADMTISIVVMVDRDRFVFIFLKNNINYF